MPDATYGTTDTIHIKISELRTKPPTAAERLRDELSATQRMAGSIYDPLFLQLLESVYDAVLLTHLHGSVIKVNSRAEEFFQFTEAEFQALNIIDLLAGATFEDLQTIHDALGSERRLFIEAECRRKDGSRFPADVTVSPMLVEDSQQYCFFVRNISTRKQTEAALHQAQEELVVTAHRAGMAEIATGVLHDVGNLLNSVNISAELIQNAVNSEVTDALQLITTLINQHQGNLAEFFTRDERGEQVPEFLAQINDALQAELGTLQQEVKHLRRKIATINDAITTQQEYAKSGLFLEPVDLAAVVEDALALQQGSLTRHDLRIEKHFRPVPPVMVQKSKLIHALVNLIKNAKDAMLETPPQDRRLLLELGQEDGQVFCRVTDNGAGIAPENLDRIFSHGFTTKPTGHGFGLHTSANFMAEMGGAITATSPGPGRGATFTLTFPAGARP